MFLKFSYIYDIISGMYAGDYYHIIAVSGGHS